MIQLKIGGLETFTQFFVCWLPPLAAFSRCLKLPEDFVRNFLFRCGMEKTFECFQQEWFERTSRGLITPSNTVAPDIYRINQTVCELTILCLL